MAKYLSKSLTEASTDNEAAAFIAVELVWNGITNRAHIKEGGWKTAQGLADGKDQSFKEPILWVEPDVSILTLVSNDYTTDTKLFDVIFDTIAYRMQTLDDLPDGSGPNPFKGCTFLDIPDPS